VLNSCGKTPEQKVIELNQEIDTLIQNTDSLPQKRPELTQEIDSLPKKTDSLVQEFEGNKGINFDEVPFDKVYNEMNGKNRIILSDVTDSGGEPGDFRKIQIEGYNFPNIYAWIKIPERLKEYSENDYFLQLDMGFEKPVLIFIGYSYASKPGYLTIISLDSAKPEIVFNYGFSISKIEKIEGQDTYKLIGGKYTDEVFEVLVEDNELKYRKVE
jgi:hypothetical protein